MKFFRPSIGVLIVLLLASGPLPVYSGAQVITLQVTAEQANVREKPDLMSPVLRQLVTGAVLEAERKEGEWYVVKLDLDTGGTVIGYIHESLVRVVPGAPAGTKPAPQAVKEPPPGETKAPPAGGQKAPQPAPQPTGATPKSPESGTPPKKEPPRSSVSLWFGGRYAMVGDLNDGAQGMADFFSAQLGAKASGEVSSVHLGSTFGAEYRHTLFSRLDGAVEVGYFSADSSSTLNFENLPTTTRYMTTPSVRAVPITLSVVFFPDSLIYFKVGAELAFAHCEYLYRFEEGGAVREWQGEADDIGIGFAVAGGLQLKITGPVSFLAQAEYRNLHLGSLDGSEVYRESGKTDVTTEGSLYFTRSTLPGGSTVTGVFIHPDFPGGTGIVEARKADLSLTGLSLRVGLKYAF